MFTMMMFSALLGAACIASVADPAAPVFSVRPIGFVAKAEGAVRIEVRPQYREALHGLSASSHIIVLYWFDQSDTPEKREVLKVHPRGDRRNPLTGIFGTRSPVRPNPIGLSVCKILGIEDGVIVIEDIEAFDKTPVIDIKPYIARLDSVPDAGGPKFFP
ncbi:MAG: tRNA (N6-threonylcarbamoyladenosine(37)-N6)-methyltransferase TrmO [Pseudomonadota bacterium]